MGLKVLLDTNAIIALLKNEGNISTILSSYSEVYISVISILEFQSFQNISVSDLSLFDRFLSRIIIVDLTQSNHLLLKEIIKIRQFKTLKLPDAIIAGTCIILNADLLSADQSFLKIKEINIVNW